ncbi:hypothetical protein ACLMJK_004093 [Lecanora helva]
MSVIFELGPGETFLFDTPGGTTTNHLPEGLKDLEAGVGQGRPIQAIYSLKFGCNGAYLLAARNAHGAIIRRNNLPPQLESWLIDPVNKTCKRDVVTLSVAFGPNGSFYARDKDGYRWHNLPDALEEAIQQRLGPAGWMARPDFVVLGADGAFIYSNDRGGCSHALGNYPKLQEVILNLQRSNVGGLTGFSLIQWVSMSLYHPGHFILLQNSGQHSVELSPSATQALNGMASTFPARNPVPQQPQPQPQQRSVSQPARSPSQTPMNHATLPIRKPVGSAAAQPRPQAPHLTSSPIPQVYPSRPVSYAQHSAPAVPQIQTTGVRPVSMQYPPQSVQQQQQQQQFNPASNNYNVNLNYSTTNVDTTNTNTSTTNLNDGGTTYIVQPTSVPISPPPDYVSPTSYGTTVVDSTNNNTNNVYNNSTTSDVTFVDTTNSLPTNTSTTFIDTTTTNNNVYNPSTTSDTTTTYTTTTDSTVYDASTGQTTTYESTTSDTTTYDAATGGVSVVDSTTYDTSTSGGDSGGGFWGGVFS